MSSKANLEDVGVCVVGGGSVSSSMSVSKFNAARLAVLGLLGRCEKVGVPGVAVDDSVRRSEYSVRRRYFRHAKNNENLVTLQPRHLVARTRKVHTWQA